MTNVPQRILVPVDLSQRSEVAVDYAAMLAASTGAELVVMTNVNHAEHTMLEQFAASEKISIEEAAVASIGRIVSERAPGATHAAVVLFFDSAADAILETSESEDVQLIVLASHGRSGMTRWMLGSVAEKVARGAHVPVVIVPARDKG